MNTDQKFLELAVELALENKRSGGRPFGAVLVKDEKVLATGVNKMLETFDPSSHAELEAIRAATKSTLSLDLSGAKIYASGHPCPMCLAAIAITGVSEIIYAFDNTDAAPFGFSSQSTYDKLGINKVTFVKTKKLDTQYSALQLYSETN